MINKFFESLLSLIYPPLCLHCRQTVDKKILCNICSQILEPLPVENRCHYCFDFIETGSPCAECRKSSHYFKAFASVFEYRGPPATLINQLKHGNKPYLAKTMGAYIVTQLIHLKWPIPDIIVPVPITLSHLLIRGYNQAELLAHSVSIMLERPYKNILIKESSARSQTGLKAEQRKALYKGIKLKSNANILDKIILLIDDVYTTGTTVNVCAKTLVGGYPAQIYAMTFCKTPNG